MPIKGLQNVLNNIKNFEKEVQDEAKELILVYTNLIERQAIQNAPGVGDSLATTFGTQKSPTNIGSFIFSQILNKGFTGIIGIEQNASKLAVYIEFGTGASAAGYVPTLPKELQQVAQSFYINGKGTLIKKPFLLPAFFRYQNEFINDFQKFLNEKGIKYSKK